MKIIAIIPARLEASRFPGKLLKDLCGATVITRTYQATLNTGLFDEVLVATDSPEIDAEIKRVGGTSFLSLKEHDCGSNRIAEAAEFMEADVVVNVQGDEPFTSREDLEKLIRVFEEDAAQEISLASLKHELTDASQIADPNNVKVITDQSGHAIYFSRAPIPFMRDTSVGVKVYKHIGIYAFRKAALMEFYQSQPTPLELTEKIECIRYLENGKKIKMVETPHLSVGIDTPADLQLAIKMWKEKEI
jgi:3-deoxy-manno-octulosonate cytidylyltransferase (CMP-KDO synthetase)